MMSMSGPSLENENEVLKIVEKAVGNFESLDHQKHRIGWKYTKKKSDVTVQTVTDINMEEIKQNTEVILKNLEQEHNKEYVKTNFESDETLI